MEKGGHGRGKQQSKERMVMVEFYICEFHTISSNFIHYLFNFLCITVHGYGNQLYVWAETYVCVW